jgi:hypothetical protein
VRPLEREATTFRRLGTVSIKILVYPIRSPPADCPALPHRERGVPEFSGPQLQPQADVVALGNVRRELDRETGYAAYLVFPNASLSAATTRLPQTRSDLGGIPGLGPKRIQAYGERIPEAITAVKGAPESEVSAPAEQAVHHRLSSSETAEPPRLPVLLEHVAKELQAGRNRLNPASAETILQDAFPAPNFRDRTVRSRTAS